MADSQSTTTVRCPQCGEPVAASTRLTYQRGANPTLTIDLAPVQAHIDAHAATYAADLPPTAR